MAEKQKTYVSAVIYLGDEQPVAQPFLAAVTAGNLEGSMAALAHHLAYTSSDLQSWMRDEQSRKKRPEP